MNTIARIRKNGDLFIIGELTESGDRDVSFDIDGNLYTSDFKEVANIPAVSRFLDGMQISGELHEGMIDKPIMDGLELWYDFRDKSNDDDYRDVAQDLSGNGNDGELVNFAFEEGSGYVEGGLRFDGVDDYGRVTGNPFSPTVKEFTIELFLRDIDSIDNPNLVGLIGQVGFTGMRLEFSEGRLYLWMGQGIDRHSVSVPVNREEEMFLAISLREGTVGFSVNGSTGYQRRINVESASSNSWELFLGARSSANSVFGGVINSFRIYSRALSDEEIAHNYAIEKERWSI